MHHLRTTTAKALLGILAILAVYISLPLILRAVAPEWWQGRHVYREEAGQVVAASDFSAANQGQLKNIAIAAYEHFLEAIPATLGGIGGTTPPPNPAQPIGSDNPAGTGWKLMKQASQWVVIDFIPADGTGTGKILRRVMNGGIPAEPEEYSITGTGPRKLAAAGTTQKDFAVINQGQLKAVAKPFYERLAELFAAFGGYAKPWTDATADDTSFAVASIGQLKNVFAFDLNRDSDGDGLTDIAELLWNKNRPDGSAPISPMSYDSDGDLLSDGYEITVLITFPNTIDTDNDGVPDGKDAYPTDARRTDDLVPRNYVAIRMTPMPSVAIPSAASAVGNSAAVGQMRLVQNQAGTGQVMESYTWVNGVRTTKYTVVNETETPIGGEKARAVTADGSMAGWTKIGTGLVKKAFTISAGGRVIMELPENLRGFAESSLEVASAEGASARVGGGYQFPYGVGSYSSYFEFGAIRGVIAGTDAEALPFYAAVRAINGSGAALVGRFVGAEVFYDSLWGAGAPIVISPQVQAYALNDATQVVGEDYTQDSRGFLWEGGQICDLLRLLQAPANVKEPNERDDFDRFGRHMRFLRPRHIGKAVPAPVGAVLPAFGGIAHPNGLPESIFFEAQVAATDPGIPANTDYYSPAFTPFILELDHAGASPSKWRYRLRRIELFPPWTLSSQPAENFPGVGAMESFTAMNGAGIFAGNAINPENGGRDAVVLLPFEIEGYKRGTINSPGAKAPKGTGRFGYETVMLENADFQDNPLGQRDCDSPEVNKTVDDDFVKVVLRWPKDMKIAGVKLQLRHDGMEVDATKTTPETAVTIKGPSRLNFYKPDGTKLTDADLVINDLANPGTGYLAQIFTTGELTLFIEGKDKFGYLGPDAPTMDNVGAQQTAAKKLGGAILRWEVTQGGTTTTDKLLVYRGGFVLYQQPTGQPGAYGLLTFYDGKGRVTNDRTDYGEQLAQWAGKSGKLTGGDCDESGGNGHIPPGWRIVFRRTDFSGAQPNKVEGTGANRVIKQGAYCRWRQDDETAAAQRYTKTFQYSANNAHDAAIGEPTTIMFKFQTEVIPPTSAAGRSEIQIHPDGKKDGTAGCIGIQDYLDCKDVFGMLTNYHGLKLKVELD